MDLPKRGGTLETEIIHLDSHVIGKPLKNVLKIMEEKWGLLDTPHRQGIELYSAVNHALKIVEECTEGKGYYFQLTPGGFFGMQHLFQHFYLEEVRQTGKNHFISSVIEEAPILKALDRMEMMGCGVKLLPVDTYGRINLNVLEESLRTKTSLLSISAVCALTGVMQPIPEIVQICHAKGVKVHINASHAMGAWRVSLKEWNVDYLTFDGDKIGTPSGIGGLFSKNSIPESPMNASLVLACAEALKEATTKQESFSMERAHRRDLFEKELLKALPDSQIICGDGERVPHIFAISFPGLMNEALLYALYRHNIDASIGGGPFQTLSHILKHQGFSEEVSLGAISCCLGSEELDEDKLARVLDVIVSSVRQLKNMSMAL